MKPTTQTLKHIGSLGRPVYAHVFGDMSRAEAPILIHYLNQHGDETERNDVPTPYQTADAQQTVSVRPCGWHGSLTVRGVDE
jgi:hypothetical protein